MKRISGQTRDELAIVSVQRAASDRLVAALAEGVQVPVVFAAVADDGSVWTTVDSELDWTEEGKPLLDQLRALRGQALALLLTDSNDSDELRLVMLSADREGRRGLSTGTLGDGREPSWFSGIPIDEHAEMFEPFEDALAA